MEFQAGEMLLVLLEKACVIVVIAYLITRTRMFRESERCALKRARNGPWL